jgi:hypothetical protein
VERDLAPDLDLDPAGNKGFQGVVEVMEKHVTWVT